MFRRRAAGRGFRRELRRLLRRGGAAPMPAAFPPDPALEALPEAQRMESLGHYAEAAELYERLAYHAQQVSRTGMAARLYLHAARCRIQGEQASLGFPSLQQAFRLLVATQDWPAVHRLARRSSAWLRQMGYATQADDLQRQLQTLLEQHLPGPAFPPAPPTEPAGLENGPTHLPTHCPSCGAALRPDEVEWLDAATAACAYCGSPVAVA